MLKKLSKLAVTAGSVAMLSTGAIATVPRPASANTATTLLTAAAAIGALVLYNNYQHKRQQANTVVGYTANGGTVYGDGRIVMPSGQSFYPNANGQYPSGQYAYYNPNANTSTYQYDPNRTGQYDRTGRHHNGNGYVNRTNNGNGWNGNGNNNAQWNRNGNGNNNAQWNHNGNGNNNAQWNHNGNGNGDGNNNARWNRNGNVPQPNDHGRTNAKHDKSDQHGQDQNSHGG